MPKARVIHLGSPKLAAVNPTKEALTKEKFRELSGLKDLPDEEAEEMVHSIHLFAKTLYEFARKRQSTCIDNQQVVSLDTIDSEMQKHAA
jgi:hypothetical protein